MPPSTRHEPTATGSPAPGAVAYLLERARPGVITVLLLLAMAYPFADSSAQAAVFMALLALAVAVAARAPRWLRDAVVVVALFLLVSDYVFNISTGPQDAKSDRDDAVELAAQSLLAGRNPWATPTQLGTPITTGPSSVLIALPSVLVTRHINACSFGFYALFVALLLAADIMRRNDTFVPLALFFVSGFFGFQYALYWSLDELAWGYLALVLAWELRRSGRPAAAGGCLALALCSRASYAFPIFAFLCWDWYRGARPRALGRLAAGAAIATLLVVAPFAWVAGADLLVHNPLSVAGQKLESAWPDTNLLFRSLNASVGGLGAGAAGLVKTAAALVAIWYGSRRSAPAAPAHPFWHMTFAALLANFLVFAAQLSNDYTLFFAVPAFLAIAHSPFGFAAAAARPPTATDRKAPRRQNRQVS